MGIHVFLGRSHTNTNNIFRLVDPVFDMDTYILKVDVFIKQAKYVKRIPYYMLRSA